MTGTIPRQWNSQRTFYYIFMESIIFLLLLAIIVLIVNMRNGVYARLTTLEKELFKLKQQAPVKPTVAEPEKKPESLPPVQKAEPVIPVQSQKVITQPVQQPAHVQPRKPVQKKPGFFERHPDLEKFIGENLVSKIGIAILVLGIGYFVKYAIDNEWIGTVGRVAIGILCGVILVSVAHYLRNNYKAFSSVLIGGGIAVFYFTIALAFHEYHLFSQPVAFIIMVLITCFAIVLSILYDRQELAIIALVGGFVAPFLVSKGSGNYIALFIYLIVLNTGLLVIALKKAWRLLNILAFAFTSLLFTTWVASLLNNDPAGVSRNGFVFAAIFYLLFFVINIIHNVRENKRFIASDFSILLLNTCFFFGTGLYLLELMGAAEFRGLFCILLSVFNLTASYFLFRKSKVDTNILYLLIGITLTFISLTAPIQLKGNYITLFWASEAVLLYWLFQKSRIRIIRLAALIVWLAMIVSLLIDIINIYGAGLTKLPIVFNKGFLTILVSAISSYFLFVLRRRDDGTDKKFPASIIPAAFVFRIVSLVLLYVAGYFEIGYQFHRSYPQINIASLYLILYTLLFIAALISVSAKFNFLKHDFRVSASLFILGILIYLFQTGYSFSVQTSLLEAPRYGSHFIAHWVSAIVVGFLLYRCIRFYRSVITEKNEWITWIICVVAIIFITAEIHLLMNALFYSGEGSLAAIQRFFIKAGWPILWGISSFALMWMGMKWKFRMLRIISLTLFTITLVKLFAYDIINIPAGGKIAAFICLGVLLLIVSFMYQRLKKILIDEETVA